MLASDIRSNYRILRLFSYKHRIRYDVTQSILETFEKLCKESPLTAIEDLQRELKQVYSAYNDQLEYLKISTLFDLDDFASYPKFRYKRMEAKIFVIRYWAGVISFLQG